MITDLGVLRPDPETLELTLTQVHEGVQRRQVSEQTGWELRVAQDLLVTSAPTDDELSALRELTSR